MFSDSATHCRPDTREMLLAPHCAVQMFPSVTSCEPIRTEPRSWKCRRLHRNWLPTPAPMVALAPCHLASCLVSIFALMMMRTKGFVSIENMQSGNHWREIDSSVYTSIVLAITMLSITQKEKSFKVAKTCKLGPTTGISSGVISKVVSFFACGKFTEAFGTITLHSAQNNNINCRKVVE